mgnify:CR=1 FL=1
MLTSNDIKEFAVDSLGIDKVGVANIERFAGAPPELDPLTIMPRAKSVVVFAKRILRGCFRGIDEGTHWPSYQVFGYGGLARMLQTTGYKLGRFIEREGCEAVPVAAVASLRERGPAGDAGRSGQPPREVTMQFRIAAALAGLGEIGWSKVFLTEEYGPRQRLGILLTDAELEPDPIRIGRICDGCRQCVRECPGGAIPEDASVELNIDGDRMAWADIDPGKCKLTHFGLNRTTAPHFVKQFPGVYLPVDQQEVTWLEAWNLGWAVFPAVPTYKALSQSPVPICGARGCIIGCMKHLEARQKVGARFRSQPGFSADPPWRLPARPPKADHHGMTYDPEGRSNTEC